MQAGLNVTVNGNRKKEKYASCNACISRYVEQW